MNPAHRIATILNHAETTYPHECCGLVLSSATAPDRWTRVVPCRNVQEVFHRMDPEHFPRTARNAYCIDPKDLLRIHREMEHTGERIRVIYHSHPDAAAYFSEEDRRHAVVNDQPLHPGVTYLVVSVVNGKVAARKWFEWQESAGTYVEALEKAAMGPNFDRDEPS